MASPHHRHQSSLEGVIDFSTNPPLEAHQHAKAKRVFDHIIDHFEATENNDNQYNRPRLVRLTYEYAAEKSKDNVLRAFFQSVALPIDGDEDVDFTNKQVEGAIRSALIGFSEYLMDNFFLPLKASTRKTPQPSPAYSSAIRSTQPGRQALTGTPARLSTLRGSCLIRDRHRCVISRKFDQNQAIVRMRERGDDARDDDGVLLDGGSFDALDVAHILPHSLTKLNAEAQLDPAREAALAILQMFDTDVAHLIEGIEIDRPRNALTLTHGLHLFFGDFQIFFEPVEGELPHTYRIDTFLPRGLVQGLLPVTRTLFLAKNRTIDPPSPQLLAVHRAIAHILHLSGAGDYIDKILRDMEEQATQADGSTDLGRIVSLILGGWLDGAVDVY